MRAEACQAGPEAHVQFCEPLHAVCITRPNAEHSANCIYHWRIGPIHWAKAMPQAEGACQTVDQVIPYIYLAEINNSH